MKKLRMYKHGTDGLLFTFCGLDGCGKSTMINRLAEWLRCEGADIMLTKEPTDFVRKSDIFRTYMDNPDHSEYDYRSLSLLATSDRVQHSAKVILPALMEGKTVISDRYFYSCLANLRARGFRKDRWIYEISESVPAPDVAFFLDVPVATALTRIRSRPEETQRYINLTLQYQLRDEYINICKKNNGVLLPTDIPEDETYSIIQNCVQKYMEEKNVRGRKSI
jgi:dTMP kinase